MIKTEIPGKTARKQNNKRVSIVFLFVLVTLVISLIYVSVMLIIAPLEDNEPFERVKSDYVLMALQCVLGILAMFLPSLLRQGLQIEIPSFMMIAYCLFLYAAIYLGEVRSFYYNVPYWDAILHAFSGMMLGALGFSFVCRLNSEDAIQMNLSPLFICCFSLCFAVTLGVIWEIYEFTADNILGTNMQKYALESGEALIGQAALTDTMKDLIVDVIGALAMSVIGYISLKHEKGWVEKFLVVYNGNSKK